MDLWIKSESERTVAGIIAIVAVLLPWEITYLSDFGGGSMLALRFPLFEFQYGMGSIVAPARGVTFRWFTEAATFHRQVLDLAFDAALVGGVLTLVAVVIGISLLATEEGSGSDTIVRILGAILVVAGISFFVAWALILTRGAAGIDIPIGAVVTPILGLVLLVAERR